VVSSDRDVARDAWQTMHELLLEGQGHDRVHRVCAEVGLSPGLLKALIHLGGGLTAGGLTAGDTPGDAEANVGVRMGDLAEHWGCDASYVTSLADGLDERGLAERRPHPTDRRVKTLVLTPAGWALRQRALDALYDPPAAFDALTPLEQRRLRDLLRKVADADAKIALSH
jgi:DNA-binding MarR family transcriptional regulator